MSQNVERVSGNLRKMIESGAPEDDITNYLKQEGFNRDTFVRAVDLSKKSGGRTAEFGFGRALAQGLTFGAADELEARARALAGQGTYEENLAALNIAKQKYEQESPVASTVGQLVGGLPYAFVPFLGQARLAQMATQAGRAGRAALTTAPSVVAGTTTGALTAAGEADPGQRLAAATGGATTGGIVGAVAPGATKVAGAIGGKVVDVTSGIPGVQRAGQAIGAATGQTIDAAKRAQEKLLEAIYRDQGTPGSLAMDIFRSRTSGKPLGIVDVGGENVRSLGDIVQKYPGTTRQTARLALEERGAEQAQRIKGDINRYLAEFQDPFEFSAQVATRQKETSAPLYRAAYDYGVVDDPRIADFLKLPQFKKASKEAKDLLEAEGREMDLTRPTVEVLDQIKRGLDVLIEKETDAVTGKVTQLGKVYRDKKNEFLRTIDDAVPEYGQARKAFAGDAEIIDATRRGQDFMKLSPDAAKREFNKLNPSEAEAYRIGAIDALRQKIDTAKDSADMRKRIFGSQAERDRIKVLFPDEDSFRAFERNMSLEASMRSTQEKILGNSATMQRQLAAQGLEADTTFIGQMIEQGPVKGTLGYLRAQGQGVAGQTAEELGKLLFKLGDPRANVQALRQLSAYERYLLDEAAKRAAGTAGAVSLVPGLIE